MRQVIGWLAGLLLAAGAFAQDAVDAKLLADIGRIRAVDNHMHADPVDAARAARWKDDRPTPHCTSSAFVMAFSAREHALPSISMVVFQ